MMSDSARPLPSREHIAALHALARDLLTLIDTYLPLRPAYHDAPTEIRDIVALFAVTPAPAPVQQFFVSLFRWLIVQDAATQQAACTWLDTLFALDLDAPIEELIDALKPAPPHLLAALHGWHPSNERNENDGESLSDAAD